MTKDLSVLQRFVIGNDPLLHALNAATADNYPPYNLVQFEKHKYKLDIAVAGFSRDQIKVEQRKDVLHIYTDCGEETESEYTPYTIDGLHGATLPYRLPTITKAPVYPRTVHQGLANRNFRKQWALGDGWKARDANLQNGVLTVIIEYEVPEDQKAVSIPITTDDRVKLNG